MTQAKGPVTEAQCEHWNNVAPAWAEWWPVIEQGAGPVTEALLSLGAVRPGDHVLDLASGIGEPAASAARLVGPRGRVLATDMAPNMVELGRDRIERLGLANVEFRLMDASAPDLPAGEFDVVLCRWGLMFVADLDDTLARVHRLLKPGGRLAIAVWGPPEQVPSISLGSRIISERLALPPPGENDRTPFDLADIDALESRLGVAGFVQLRHQPVNVVYDFPSDERFLAYRKELSQIERRLGHIEAAQREAAWHAVAEALAPYRTPEGRIVMENLAICLGGRRS